MNYEQRQALIAAAQAKVPEVAKAGETLGLWKIVRENRGDDGDLRSIEVRCPEDRRYLLDARGWDKPGTVSLTVAARLRGAHSTYPRDVLRYNQDLPEASASHTRSAETIAKDLHRRVCATPEGQEVADKVAAALAAKVASRLGLEASLADLRRLGYEPHNLDPQRTHDAEVYGPEPVRRVTVTHAGQVRIQDLYIPLDRFPALLAFLRGE